MKVLIRSQQLKEVVSRKAGPRQGTVYFFQQAALDNGTDFPHPFEIIHDDPKKAYPPGEYTFAPDAIYVAQNGANAGKLSVSPRLVPIAKPTAKAA